MKRWAALSAMLVIFILTTAFQTRPPSQLRSNARVTVATDYDSRATFEALAKAAGMRIIFAKDFVSGQLGSSTIDMSVSDALDLISKQTGNLWSTWDVDTIVVAPDNEINRRTYERVFVVIIEIPRQQDPKTILSGLKGAIAVGNKVVVKDTLSGIEKAKQAVAEQIGVKSDETQVSRLVSLKTLTQGLAGELVSILRAAFSMRQVEQNGAYSVSMKDTPQRIAIAEQIIANLDRP